MLLAGQVRTFFMKVNGNSQLTKVFSLASMYFMLL